MEQTPLRPPKKWSKVSSTPPPAVNRGDDEMTQIEEVWFTDDGMGPTVKTHAEAVQITAEHNFRNYPQQWFFVHGEGFHTRELAEKYGEYVRSMSMGG